jgi:hypothetical protein
MNTIARKASILFCLVAIVGSSRSAEPVCFTAMVNPSGWPLPKTTGVVYSGPYHAHGIPPSTTVTRYETAESMWIPAYYVESNRLVMRSLMCRFEEPRRLEYAGRPYAFFASAWSLNAGVAGEVWWLDRDGDGSFEEFQWIPNGLPVFPSWVGAEEVPAR